MRNLTQFIQEAKSNTFNIYINSEHKEVVSDAKGVWKYNLNDTVTNAVLMFSNCKNLSKLDLSNFDTSKVENMSSMFRSCENLTELDLSNFDTSKVENMSSMFNKCYNLTELDLSNFDTSKVKYMNSMFYLCSSLKSLDLSSFDTSKVATMYEMFRKCSSLTELDISNFNTSNVATGRMFYGCKALKSVYVTNCNAATVEKIKNAVKEAGLSEDIVKTSK